MSLNAYGDDKGAMGAGGGAGALSQAPRLRAGCYAAWKPDMDVYLARIGADGVHKRAMSATDWQTIVDKLELWKSEEAAQYLADIGIASEQRQRQQQRRQRRRGVRAVGQGEGHAQVHPPAR